MECAYGHLGGFISVNCNILYGMCGFIFAPGKNNSRTMLLPLLQRFPEQMRVSLYHTPDLRGLLRLLVPERFNETIGVQHIKVYLFDNSLIISGYELMNTHSYIGCQAWIPAVHSHAINMCMLRCNICKNARKVS